MSDVEILHDPVQAAYASGAGTIYDRSRHEVLNDPPWLESVKREFERPQLFQYRHRDTGNFVLASWMFHPKDGKGPGLFIELEAYPDRETFPTRDYLRMRFRPADEQARDIQRRCAEKQQRAHELRKESRRDALKAAKRLKRMGLDYEAHQLQIGATPYIGEAEAADGGESREKLNDMARD